MEAATNIDNLMDIDSLIQQFLIKCSAGVHTIHNHFFDNNNSVSVRAFIAELTDELRTGCVTFFNKGYDIEELDSYLFYIVNATAKKMAVPKAAKKNTDYLCPGCLFLGKESLVVVVNNYFRCDDCEDELKVAKDPQKIIFFRTFFKHSKNGYHCGECKRFIPHPIDGSPSISCPYYDCCFVGAWQTLPRMHHPNSQTNAELVTLDASLKKGGSTFKDLVVSDDVDVQTKMEVEEDLENKIKMLKGIIETQSNSAVYTGHDFTVKHKLFVYEAFTNLLRENPTDMIDYLLNNSRSGGFQHKVFQEYIRLLEAALPFSFKKGGNMILIESLLDKNLNLFDGISEFDAMVSETLSIKNNTQEFYIGGRKGAISRPYYIGKLLSVIDKKTKTPLTDNVVNYTFSKIKMRDVTPGTEVIVSHLRVPPHYQMGGMVYINRIRKKIVERARIILGKQDAKEEEV